jgi:hypothetical protein
MPISRYQLTDPGCRSKDTSGHGSCVVGYNVHVAVETENHLIITYEVTHSGSDRAQLSKVAKSAKEVLRGGTLDAVADRGYPHITEGISQPIQGHLPSAQVICAGAGLRAPIET